jgi:hypothetical protein
LTAQSDSTWQSALPKLTEIAQWSAFQLRMNNNEMHLSGYCSAETSFFQQYAAQQVSTCDFADRLPMDCYGYTARFTPQTSAFMDSTFAPNLWQELHPETLYFFTLNYKDTITYYTLLQTDTAHNLIAKFANDTLPDIVYRKNYTIYKTHFADLTKEGKQSLSYMTPCKESYIFAKSPEALQHYLDRIITDKTLSNSNFYKYAHSHLPSERCFEFFGQNIACAQLLTFTFATPDHNFIPITIYVRF